MIKEFLMAEEGMGTVEIILIIAVLVAIVTVFKAQIKTLVVNIWTSINKGAKNIYST